MLHSAAAFLLISYNKSERATEEQSKPNNMQVQRRAGTNNGPIMFIFMVRKVAECLSKCSVSHYTNQVFVFYTVTYSIFVFQEDEKEK